ncbi:MULTISPECIES: RNA polymerase sigma factor [unclassified Imperialibacter]|uniref:RNA polymerase sigma factor n=1 Tax=unclassified Imperialibacter TaxID=2629706 RepID=UPI0012524DE2|nr:MULTISPECIES: RNA polymerase sigma factor [unclassified Imperialibacter]CAD5277229.1 RNA polymerase sigma factor, sigma-70 family [Imperialibacter sp. 75]CAD5295203.1 RNA polymerase sigma factor, sigma-70 family [Imperialibacter sp. 89]VVT12193.1 RNA polymerase sigma factor, sigma-70 family [Imperialibacter sp. EC-SDR9]
MNPLSNTYSSDASDKALIEQTLTGSKKALNQLIERHQPYIYNIAWKMVGNPADAADLSQEVLIKIVSNLGKFGHQSSFRTWAYRIVVNHFLNDKKKLNSKLPGSFEEMAIGLEMAPDVELSQEEKEEKKEAIREVRLTCLSGMLLCLTKEQRMIYLIGEVFDADHNVGSELMEMSKPNYRMKLSKARKDLHQFMQHKCGLVNKTNPCRCHKKVTVSLESGLIDARNLLYNQKEYSTFREQLGSDASYLVDEAEMKYAELHRDHSFKTIFEKKNFLMDILDDANWKSRLNLN